jgi:hypothetical protein
MKNLIIDRNFDKLHKILSLDQMLESCEIMIKRKALKCGEPILKINLIDDYGLRSVSSMFENLNSSKMNYLLNERLESGLEYIKLQMKPLPS